MGGGVEIGPRGGGSVTRPCLGRLIYCATGPVTNVAARLCELATHGRILVTGEIARALHGAYSMRRLGRRRLRNVSALVEVFEVLGGEAR